MSCAVILAAGMGTRLGKYTSGLPKGMLSFLGQSLLERQVSTLRRCGVRDISIVRGYAADAIDIPKITYFENPDYSTTNMVASLMTAREKLLSAKDSVIVNYADIIFEDRLVTQLQSSPAPVSVLADDAWLPYWQARLDDWKDDVESLQYDGADRLVEIGTPRCPVPQCQSRYVGMLKFSTEGVKAFISAFDENAALFWESPAPWRRSKSFRQAYMTCMLQELVERKVDVRVVRTRHGWMEFDTVEDYEKALSWSQEGSLSRFIDIGAGECK